MAIRYREKKCTNYAINEASLNRFWDHYQKGIPIAVFTTYRTDTNKRQLNKEKVAITQKEADKIFLSARARIKAQGFGFIKGDGFYTYAGEDKPTPEHCYIVYGIPLEDDPNVFYDGTVDYKHKRVIHGYSPAEAENRLTELAISFGKEFNQQSVLLIDRNGRARLHYLEHVETERYDSKGNTYDAVFEDGDEEALGSVEFYSRGDGVYTEIKGKPFACRMQFIDNGLNEAGNSYGDLLSKVHLRNTLIEQFETEPWHYFA